MKGLEGMVSRAMENVARKSVEGSGVQQWVETFVVQLKGRFDQIDAKLDRILAAQEAIAQRLDMLEARREIVDGQ